MQPRWPEDFARKDATANMGGFGSGYFSWRRLPRNLVEQAFVLDLAALGRLKGAAGAIASGHLTLVARATGEALQLRYVADLTDAANPHLRLTFRAAGKHRSR